MEVIADRLNAVVAFNADYITRQDDGYVFRQGVLFKDKLKGKWQAFLDCGALASEMESAALFIICAVRRARGGCVVQVFANQTRRAMGLEDPMVLDTDAAVRVGVQGMRRLILRDKASE